MSAYIKALNGAVAAEHDQKTDHQTEAAHAARARLTPLEDRLARLLATIPVDAQHEGLSLPALQAALRGRWRGSCHPGELGAALRKLGFSRVRRWSTDASFSTIWRRG